MVLPFTVATSFIFLHPRPSLMVLMACSVVTFGFFIGVFLDGTPVSLIGISFGVASSMVTAVHSVVIKKSLEVVKGSALHLSWYTNLFSAVILFPLLILLGEGPGVMNLLFGSSTTVAANNAFSTFMWGSIITVRSHVVFRRLAMLICCDAGCIRIPYEHRKFALNQGHFAHHPHGLIRRTRSGCISPRHVAFRRDHQHVCVSAFAFESFTHLFSVVALPPLRPYFLAPSSILGSSIKSLKLPSKATTAFHSKK